MEEDAAAPGETGDAARARELMKKGRGLENFNLNYPAMKRYRKSRRPPRCSWTSWPRKLLCTGFSELVDEKRAKELGIREFLLKPIRIPNLAKVVRRVLDETRIN